MCSQNENNIEEADNKISNYVYTHGMPLYILLPLCALGSTFICTGGWRSGLRATLLGASLLLGIYLLKKSCSSETKWLMRTILFAFVGIFAGLLAASVIGGLETLIGSPTLQNNPYNQETPNLFLVCPLYGFFMLGCYSLAFNLPRFGRYFIVLAGAAFVNLFGVIDITAGNIVKEVAEGVFYYLTCAGNCAWFVLLWNRCADGIFYRLFKKRKAIDWILIIVASLFLGYFGYMMVGAGSVQIANERYLKKYKNTAFKERLTGFIILLKENEYYDCHKKEFCKIKSNIPSSDNGRLKVKSSENNKCLYIEKINDDKTVEKITYKLPTGKRSGFVYATGDRVYYKMDWDKLYCLKGPEYNKPELVIDNFESYRYCVSPCNKFIAYQGGANHVFSSVFCIMNLKSKKVLAIKLVGAWGYEYYWTNNLDEIKNPGAKK